MKRELPILFFVNCEKTILFPVKCDPDLLSRHFLPPTKLNVSISVGIFNHVHAWSDMAAACLIYPRKPLQNVRVRSLLLLSTRLSLKTMTLPMKTWINYLLKKLKQNRTARIMVVQYTRTVTVRISHVSIRTDRTDRQKGYTVCKECLTVRKSHLISGT